jgi:branched-subunit amino acid ABC-type transport system permease component
MNKILYCLVGMAVASAVGISMFDPSRGRPIKFDGSDQFVLVVCLLVTAAGLLFLTRTSLGKRLKASLDKRAHDEEDRVRTTSGEVRKPNTTWWGP